MELPKLIESIVPVLWGVLAMLIARAVAIYGLIPLVNRFSIKVPFKWQHILLWGGLRGSLSIALALSLPASFPDRSQLVTMIFGVVIFSLLFQGLTISPLLKWLGFAKPETERKDYEIVHGKLLGDGAALSELQDMQTRGMITERVFQVLRNEVTQSQEELRRRATEFGDVQPAIEKEQIRRIRRHLTDVRKARLRELMREGILTSAVHEEIEQQLDRELPET